MPRIRTIKPEFPQSETIGRLTRDARLLFIQLWTIADDEGRTKGHSKTLASLLYLYDDDAYAFMDGWIQELERECCIVRYQVDGNTYVKILNWSKHQKIDKAGKSRIPAFVEASRILDESSPTSRESSTTPRDSSTTDLVPRTVVSRTEDLVSRSVVPSIEDLSLSGPEHPTSEPATPNAREREQDFQDNRLKQEHGQRRNFEAEADALASSLCILSGGTIHFLDSHKKLFIGHLKNDYTLSELETAFRERHAQVTNDDAELGYLAYKFSQTANQTVDSMRREKANHELEGKAVKRKAAEMQADVNPDTLVKGLDALKDAGLGTESLTSNGLIRRGGASALRSLGVGATKAEKVSAGLQALVGAGFTAQNAYQAAELSPKVLDALKDGDYDAAARLAVDALGTGALAGIGAHELASESGSLMDAAKAKAGLEVNPTETNLELQKNAGILKRDVDTAGFTNKNWAEDVRKIAPKATPEQLERIKYYVEAGGDEDLMAQRHNILAEIAGKGDQIPLTSPENGQPVTTGMTPERVQELVDSKQMTEKYTPVELAKLKDAYDPRKLTDTDRTIAKQILDKHNETLEEAQENDLLGEGVKNYSTNIWKPEDQTNGAANRLAHDANSGMFAQNTSQARARMFDSAFEGQLLGKKLAETDPISLAANNANSFARVKAARDFRERLLDQGTQASDGAPMAAISGNAHYDPETGTAMVNGDNLRNIKIADPVIQGLKDNGQLDRLIDNGQIVDLTPKITAENIQQSINALEKRSISAPITYDAGGNSVTRNQIQQLKDIRDGKLPMSTLDQINENNPSVYAWNTDNYASIDHPMLRGVKHVLTTPSGDNVFVQGDVRVHPEAQEYLQRILGTDSKGPGEGPIGNVAGKLGREAKGILLFGSPFHIFQEGLRGIMTGVNPFGLDRIDLASDPVLAKGVEHGLTLGQDHSGLSAFKDGELKGNSKIISKIPGLNRVQSGVDHFLFDKYVPTLKARAYQPRIE